MCNTSSGILPYLCSVKIKIHIVYTFLEQYDLKGKTVIPFCTAYSGPSQTLKDIIKSTPDSDHREGICIVTKELGGQGMDGKTAKIDKRLGEIGF